MLSSLKLCRFCNTQKPFSEFYKDGNIKSKIRSYCNFCSSDKVRQIRGRKNRLEKGLCAMCTTPRLHNHQSFCEKHYIGNVAWAGLRKNNNKVVEELTKKFRAQKHCPYTGEELILGFNAHLDHILSKEKHPELAEDIDNVEWISKKANLAKNGMDKQEFIDFCKLIALRHTRISPEMEKTPRE